MATVLVGQRREFTAAWANMGANAPTAATFIVEADGPLYLQADLISLGASPHSFAASSLGGGSFRCTLAAVPSVLQHAEWCFVASATGPAAFYPTQSSDGYYVTVDDIDTSMASVLAAEVVTQGKVDQIGAASEAQLLAPQSFAIPDSGTKTFVLEFILKDLDTSPVALVDPDGNVATLTAIDQTGAAPTGLVIPSGGAMVRDAAGRYHASPTISSAGVDGTQIRWSVAFSVGGVANIAKATTILGDFDQLDTIQSQVDAIRSTDFPNIKGPGWASPTDTLKGIRDAIGSLPSPPSAAAIAAAVWDEAVASHVLVGSFGKLVQDSQALLSSGTFGLSALQVILASVSDRLGIFADDDTDQTIFGEFRRLVSDFLADPDFGLAALDDGLDAIAATLGITTDTGGTVSAGSVFAKLNAILVAGSGGGGQGLDIQEKP